ncbi:hypothetical protein HK100_001250 [Physocladia obscura]|uniref:BHLH domain-containing protein n=1 Tax=Physocladia obscura TaxID=109957 RepID=A0AAD5SXE1_9FUNG|nr:hypothetical protein HK100_001250 [Physocladia obscura]
MPTQNPSTSSVPNQNPNANSHGKTILPTPKAFGRQAVTSKQFFPHSPQAQSQYQLQSQLFHSPFDATSELLTTPFQTNLFSPIPFPLLNNPIDLMSPFSPILPPISAASPSQLTFSPQRVFEAEIMELSPQLLGFIQHQQQPVAAQTIWPNLNPITGSIPAFDTGLSNTELLCSPFKFLYPSPLPQWSQQSSPLSPSRVKGTAVLSLSPSQSSAAPPPARTTPLQIMNATMATKSNSKKRSVFGTSDNSLNSVISTVAKPKPRKKIKTRLSFEVVHANNLNDKNSGGFASPVPSPTDSVAIACGAGSNSLVWEFLNANDSPQSLSQLNMDVDINSTAALSTTNNEISVKMRHSVVTSVPVLTKAKRIFIEPSNRKEYRKDAEKHRREVLKGVFDGLNELIPSKKRKSRIPREQLLGNGTKKIFLIN